MKVRFRYPEDFWVCVVFVLAALMVAAILKTTAAHGHAGDDALSGWYRSLTAPDGTNCCNMLDCSPTEAKIENGQWWAIDPTRIKASLPPQPIWLPVPPEAVLHRENPDGRPIACILGGVVKCFVPPSGA